MTGLRRPRIGGYPFGYWEIFFIRCPSRNEPISITTSVCSVVKAPLHRSGFKQWDIYGNTPRSLERRETSELQPSDAEVQLIMIMRGTILFCFSNHSIVGVDKAGTLFVLSTYLPAYVERFKRMGDTRLEPMILCGFLIYTSTVHSVSITSRRQQIIQS